MKKNLHVLFQITELLYSTYYKQINKAIRIEKKRTEGLTWTQKGKKKGSVSCSTGHLELQQNYSFDSEFLHSIWDEQK